MFKYCFIIIFLFVFSCNQKPTEEILLDKEIMKLHDEAMAKSGLLLSLKNELNTINDSTKNFETKDSLQSIALKLKKADRMMLDWMHQYNSPNLENDSAKNYLMNQLVKIKAVHEITFESIKEAKTILKK